MPSVFANNASTTLASAITNAVTSLTLASGTGALFPALAGANFFYATLIDASNHIEIVKVTARSSDTLTVVRGQEGTTARAYAIGDKVELRITAAGLANKVAYDDPSFVVTEAQVTGLVAALAALSANQIPAGSRTVFHQAAAPSGWTQDATNNDIAIRVVGGTGGGAYTAGQAFSGAVATGTVSGHSITQAELPNCAFPVSDPGHAHPVSAQPVSGMGSGGPILQGTSGRQGVFNTDPAYTGIGVNSGGSGTAHGHGFSGAAISLNYMNFIMCVKN